MSTLKQRSRGEEYLSRLVGIPSPFVAAPSKLEPFLAALDPERVYIFHIDDLPRQFKRKIFAVPLVLNIAIVILLAWRAYAIFPTYANLFLIAMGYPSSASVDTAGRSSEDLRWLVLKRASMVLFDFVLFRFVGFWPFAFVFEQPVSPMLWRWKLGFRDREVVIRVSKQWGAKDFWDATSSIRGREVTSTNPILSERILPAIDSGYLSTRTGYMMMGREFDLDLPAMLDAEQMLEKGEASYEDFLRAVVIHLDGTGWVVWNLQGDVSARKLDAEEEEARRRIETFRDRLVAMGKEHLFYRWIELVQFESQQPGGLTPFRQDELIGKARDLFSREGINFDALFASVGGVDGFPGLGKDK